MGKGIYKRVRKITPCKFLPDNFRIQDQRVYIIGRKTNYFLLINLDSGRPYEIRRREIIEGLETVINGHPFRSFRLREMADEYWQNLDHGAPVPVEYISPTKAEIIA